ncbi:hypothetical protein ABPG72_015344 [Tetrahymena utriculariae]
MYVCCMLYVFLNSQIEISNNQIISHNQLQAAVNEKSNQLKTYYSIFDIKQKYSLNSSKWLPQIQKPIYTQLFQILTSHKIINLVDIKSINQSINQQFKGSNLIQSNYSSLMFIRIYRQIDLVKCFRHKIKRGPAYSTHNFGGFI